MSDQTPERDRIYIGTRDAAQLYEVNERTIRKRLQTGKLAGHRINDRWVVAVDPAELDAAGMSPTHEDDEPPIINIDQYGPPPPVSTAMQLPAPELDLTPLATTIDRLSAELTTATAAAAMWQERARALQERVDQQTRALEAGPAPDRPWWRRLIGD